MLQSVIEFIEICSETVYKIQILSRLKKASLILPLREQRVMSSKNVIKMFDLWKFSNHNYPIWQPNFGYMASHKGVELRTTMCS